MDIGHAPIRNRITVATNKIVLAMSILLPSFWGIFMKASNKNDYTQNNLYYNQDNSRYYASIDNSTDEYYLIDVQYSPTFVTVNYTYNTTNINNKEEVGDVTNVYYYELAVFLPNGSATGVTIPSLSGHN